VSSANSDSRTPRFALVDANNFYASCETIFKPHIAGRPVVVLSNNDGCVIARSAEAKLLGFKMGDPWFKVKDEPRSRDVVVFSSNHTLYADMSSRFQTILSDMAPRAEIYSIDESFLDVTGIAHVDRLAVEIRGRVRQWTGLPVCVGVGATKTRAKLANFVAKKRPEHNGTFNLEALTRHAEDALLDGIPTSEVWGIGAASTEKLKRLGIECVRQLRDAPPKRIREHFTVVMERTVAELNGTPCLSLESVAPAKQEIVSSRSFGRYIRTLEELTEAVLSYAARAAQKLREQQCTTQLLCTFLETNPFKPEAPQYNASRVISFNDSTDDTLLIGRGALAALRRAYRPGYDYKKAGVLLAEIAPKANRQATLFDDPDELERRDRLNQAMDALNLKFGRGTLQVAAAGRRRPWTMKRERLSPCYTTDWQQIPLVG
jgi:DNA polymerase V